MYIYFEDFSKRKKNETYPPISLSMLNNHASFEVAGANPIHLSSTHASAMQPQGKMKNNIPLD